MSSVEKRRVAMKRYFGYVNKSRECLRKPYPIKFEDKDYISFTNSWSLILTTETCDGLEMYDATETAYPDVISKIRFDGIKKKINIGSLIVKAKNKGYRLTKNLVNYDFNYLLHYDGSYYNIALLDISYSIINNGEIAMIYHPDGERMPLTIQNSIGICMIMPIIFYHDQKDDGRVIIEIE